MTAKRFTDVWCSETGHIGITDNSIDKEFTGSEFEEFLNELHEENRELQRHLDVMRSGALTDDKRIKELYDKNEQLKYALNQRTEQCDKYYQENEQLKQEIKAKDKIIELYCEKVKE